MSATFSFYPRHHRCFRLPATRHPRASFIWLRDLFNASKLLARKSVSVLLVPIESIPTGPGAGPSETLERGDATPNSHSADVGRTSHSPIRIANISVADSVAKTRGPVIPAISIAPGNYHVATNRAMKSSKTLRPQLSFSIPESNSKDAAARYKNA